MILSPLIDRLLAGSKQAHFFVGYAVLVVAYALVALRLEPSEAVPSSAAATEFSAERAISTLRRVLGPGERPHPMGSEANRAVADRIVEVLREQGRAPEIVEGTACGRSGLCGRARDIVVRGQESWPRILIAAHHDSVPAGPGAADDGAGVATLLELSRAIADGAPVVARPWLLFTDGEEVDLLGAELFVRSNLGRFDFILNLDARGTGGPVLMFQTNPESAQAVRWYAQASRHPISSSLLHSIYELLPNDTDFTVLDRGGEAGLNFAFIGNPLRYHTALDRVDLLDPRSVQHQGEQLLGLLSTPPPAPTAGRVVYFDLLGGSLIVWSQAWNAAVAGAALLACGAGARRLGARWRAWKHAALVWAVAFALGGFAGALAALGSAPWVAEPAGLEAAALCFGVLGAVGASLLAARWVSPEEAWAGFWVPFAGLGVVSHFVLAGVSFLFVVPALLAGLAVVLAPARFRSFAFALGGLAAVLVLGPPARYLYDGLGREGLAVLTLLAAIAAFALSPLWLMGSRTPRARALGLVAPAAALLVAGLVGWSAPHLDADDPAGVWRLARLAPARPASWLVGAFSPSFARQAAPAVQASSELPTSEPPLPWQGPAFYVDTGQPAAASVPWERGVSAQVERGRIGIEALERPTRLELSVWLSGESKAEVRMDGELARPYREAGWWRATWAGAAPAQISVTWPESAPAPERVFVAELHACEGQAVCAAAPPLSAQTADYQMGRVVEIVHRLDELTR